MNQFIFAGSGAADPIADDLRALGLMFLFGDEFVTKPNPTDAKGTDLMFPLSFALTNLTTTVVTQTSYDTRYQRVNEYSDKPYAVKGYLAVVLEPKDDVGTAAPDFDNFIRIPYENITSDPGTQQVFIGICNSTQTDFYTPFSSLAVKVFFQRPVLSNLLGGPLQGPSTYVGVPGGVTSGYTTPSGGEDSGPLNSLIKPPNVFKYF